MPWRPEVLVTGEDGWKRNGMVFATRREAEDQVFNLALSWLQVRNTRVVETGEAPTYRWSNHAGLEALRPGEEGGHAANDG
jgi:hypothetical protein